MKYKLLMISPGPKFSLSEKFYEQLSNDFCGTIITTSSDSQILAKQTVADFDFHCIRFLERFTMISNIWLLVYSVFFALRQRLGNTHFDIVVTYDPIKTGLIGVLVSKILNSKFAPEVNGVYTSDAEYLDGSETFSVKLKKNLIPKIMRFVIKHADGIKLLFDKQLEPFSQLTKDKCIARYPNYVDTKQFVNFSDEKEILFVGFPFKRKGVDILINAFKSISEKHPDWKLKILGWYPNMEELDHAIDGDNRIIYQPPVMHKEMPEYVGRCGILVLPSRSEAMGRILVESMAAGKPRIGANVDGIPTVIKNNVDGLLFQSENVKDLAEKLELLITNNKLRELLGHNAKERAAKEFSAEVYFKNKYKFYSDVINGSGK